MSLIVDPSTPMNYAAIEVVLTVAEGDFSVVSASVWANSLESVRSELIQYRSSTPVELGFVRYVENVYLLGDVNWRLFVHGS